MVKKKNTHIISAASVIALLILLLVAFPVKAEAADPTVYIGNVALINDGSTHAYNQSGAAISGWTRGSYVLSKDSSTLYINGITYTSSEPGIYGIFPIIR